MLTAGFLFDWFGFPLGVVLTNLIASAIWVLPGAVWLHSHFKCKDCSRPGVVPVKGTHFKACHKHAEEQGHVHR